MLAAMSKSHWAYLTFFPVFLSRGACQHRLSQPYPTGLVPASREGWPVDRHLHSHEEVCQFGDSGTLKIQAISCLRSRCLCESSWIISEGISLEQANTKPL